MLIIIPLWLLIFAAFKLYSPNTLFGGMQEYASVFNAVTMGTCATIVIDFVIRDPVELSRGWLLTSWFLALILVIGARFVFRRTIYAIRKRGHLLSLAILIGADNEGKAIAEQLRNGTSSGLRILGFID